MPDPVSTDGPFEFPCEFPVKAMGLAAPGFQELVVDVVSNHVPLVSVHAVRSNLSSNGKYISVTVLVTASSREQLDDIYRDLTARVEVLMAL